jgi:predicted nucleotidyltransferase
MTQSQAAVQERYWTALNALVDKLKQDRYVLAAILFGSLARGDAWERSDIDLVVILRDGLEREARSRWLIEDGIGIWTEVVTRNHYKRIVQGTLQGSIAHSVHSLSKLLFSKDESIEAWFNETGRIGARDQELQLLNQMSQLSWSLDKAEKWLYARRDLHYSFMWLMYVVNNLARIEVVLNGEAPEREVIHQALGYNPAFFSVVYTDLISKPKDEPSIQNALDLIGAYLSERAERLCKPILDYLAEAKGVRAISELEAHLEKKGIQGDLLGVCGWLARKGIIEKVAAPLQLTRKSQVTLQEPAFYYDRGDISDWE